MTNILHELRLYKIHETAARPRGLLLPLVKLTVIWAQTNFL